MKYTHLFIILFSSTLLLSGCDTLCKKSQPEVIVKYEYITRIPPKELLTIPDETYILDITNMTQADIAAWILENNKRTKILENNIKGIGEFLNKSPTK